MEKLIFLVEKRDKSIQGRAFANGTSSQREYMERDKVASPTHHHDGISYDNSNDWRETKMQCHDGRYNQY